MRIKWFGHSAFGIISKSGKFVLTDPYEPNGYNGAVRYKPITVNADAVTISHNHADHNYTKALSGTPAIIDKKGNYEVTWDGTNNFGSSVASGQYVYTLKYGNFSKSLKMTLLK